MARWSPVIPVSYSEGRLPASGWSLRRYPHRLPHPLPSPARLGGGESAGASGGQEGSGEEAWLSIMRHRGMLGGSLESSRLSGRLGCPVIVR